MNVVELFCLFSIIFLNGINARMKHFSSKPQQGLRSIPGVGKSIERDLRDLGIDRSSCLKGKNPERLYQRLCRLRGRHVDRCMLYVFRCAVYFVSEKRHEPEKLKWWNWKD